MKKQFLAKLLVLAMVLAMMPVTFLGALADAEASASGGNDAEPTFSYQTYSSATGDTTNKIDDEDFSGEVEADVIGASANVSLTATAVAALADNAKDGEMTLNIGAEGATKVSTTFPAKALTEAAESSGADLVMNCGDVAVITIPNDVLKTEIGTVGVLKISVSSNNAGVSFSIQCAGESMSLKGMTITF